WTREEYESHRAEGSRAFRSAGGNALVARGVRAGDRLYIVSFMDGRLYRLGRIVVARVGGGGAGPRHAAGPGCPDGFHSPWASDWAFADPAASSAKHFDLVLPPETVRAMRFGAGRPPAMRGDGPDATPDPQTFRGVRRITDATAVLLDEALARRAATA